MYIKYHIIFISYQCECILKCARKSVCNDLRWLHIKPILCTYNE